MARLREVLKNQRTQPKSRLEVGVTTELRHAIGWKCEILGDDFRKIFVKFCRKVARRGSVCYKI